MITWCDFTVWRERWAHEISLLYLNANRVRDCVVLIHLCVIVFDSLCALVSCPKGTWLMSHFLSSCLYGIATRWMNIACTDNLTVFMCIAMKNRSSNAPELKPSPNNNQQPKEHTYTHTNKWQCRRRLKRRLNDKIHCIR